MMAFVTNFQTFRSATRMLAKLVGHKFVSRIKAPDPPFVCERVYENGASNLVNQGTKA